MDDVLVFRQVVGSRCFSLHTMAYTWSTPMSYYLSQRVPDS